MNALALLLLAGVASALPGRPDADPQYATPPPIEASYDAPASARYAGYATPARESDTRHITGLDRHLDYRNMIQDAPGYRTQYQDSRTVVQDVPGYRTQYQDSTTVVQDAPDYKTVVQDAPGYRTQYQDSRTVVQDVPDYRTVVQDAPRYSTVIATQNAL
ncbi:uncharacterized protein LOC122393087 [Amphibalanus amphitrite]|uniref:uncharacterized protein LOC122393087 n=1 Tax=Amphibalanus amphitrite TaxID=1232801 RepID=UPI001C8FD2EB|nr:uncharacterized protein LOC122393087 [Amphibalanus amphitrite]